MFRAFRQNGMVALVVTMVVLGIVTMVTLFTARVIVSDQKIYKNVYDRAAAQNAAQAGFDYGYAYFAENSSTILTTNLSSCASATNTYTLPTTDSPLPNGATFAMQFGCVATNTNVISLSATGKNADNSSTNTVSALLKSTGGSFANYAVIGQANNGGVFGIDMNNTVSANNSTTGAKTSVASGGTVRLRTTASVTTTTTGTPYSCAGNKTLSSASPPAATTCQDVSYSNATLSGMSTANFETNFIGRSISSFSSLATVYNIDCTSGNKNFVPGETFAENGCTGTGSGTVFGNSPASITGAIIYINMGSRSLTITTNAAHPAFLLGSAAAPVILVINSTGNITINAAGSGQSIIINGNIYTNSDNFIRFTKGNSLATGTLNGILFSSGPVQVRGGTTVNGVVVGAQVDIQTNGTTINYIPANISNTLSGYYGSMLTPASGSGGGYGIVSGSWKDF